MRVSVEISGRISDDWRDEGACLDYHPDVMFPHDEDRNGIGHAKEVCRGCDVREDCLNWSLQQGELYGVWGGYTVRERLQIARQRAHRRKVMAR